MEHPLHDSNSWFEPFHTSHVTFLKKFFYIIDYVYVFSIYSEKIYIQDGHWYGKFCHSKIFAMPRKPQNKRADVYFSTSGTSSPLYNSGSKPIKAPQVHLNPTITDKILFCMGPQEPCRNRSDALYESLIIIVGSNGIK